VGAASGAGDCTGRDPGCDGTGSPEVGEEVGEGCEDAGANVSDEFELG